MVNQKVCKKKYLSWVYGVDRKICHSGSLFAHSDPRDRFFYPHHTHMKDTYNLKLFLGSKLYLLTLKNDKWDNIERSN